MFSGKLYFNYIYGIGLLGCMAMYCLLNLMSVAGVSLTCVVSVLGYCLLPIVGLSGVSILFSLSGFLGNILTGAAVTWCAVSSSKVSINNKLMCQPPEFVSVDIPLLKDQVNGSEGDITDVELKVMRNRIGISGVTVSIEKMRDPFGGSLETLSANPMLTHFKPHSSLDWSG